MAMDDIAEDLKKAARWYNRKIFSCNFEKFQRNSRIPEEAVSPDYLPF